MDYAVLFDLDGTLINTDLLIEKSFRYVFELYKPEYDLSYEEVLSFMGPPLVKTFENHFSKDMVDELVDVYRTYNIKHHNDFVTIYPTIEETLKILKDKGYKLGVVTTKMNDVAKLGLEMFNLTDYFDCIIGSNDIIHAKPHPEGVYKALDVLGCKKGVMIGDNESDLLAGKNANIDTIGIGWSPKGTEGLLKVSPDLIVDEMIEIISFVEGRI